MSYSTYHWASHIPGQESKICISGKALNNVKSPVLTYSKLHRSKSLWLRCVLLKWYKCWGIFIVFFKWKICFGSWLCFYHSVKVWSLLR
jgi:hypothetical protein